MRIVRYLIIMLVAVVLVFALAKDAIVKMGMEKGTKIVTGLDLAVEEVNVGLLTTLIDIKGLKLYNPPDYKDRVMVDMPEIYVDYDLPAMIVGDVHLKEVRIVLDNFTVVKNADGELNLNSLKVVQAETKAEKEPPAKKAPAPEFSIDKLYLKIDTVVYKDYSGGGSPSVKTYSVGIDREFSDIDDVNKLASLIIVQALTKTAISNLTDFDVKALEGTLGKTLQTAQQVAGKAVQQAGDTLSRTEDLTGGVVKGTTDTIKKTTESLGGLIKSPFGGSTSEEK